jgi:hypothetical protein
MLSRVLGIFLTVCWLTASATPAGAVLEVVLDTNGSGTETFTDVDGDGILDFNTTVGGVLEARARAKQTVEGINGKIALAPMPPFSDGIFRNISGVPQTFTVTVKSSTLATAVGPPIGWDVFYRAAVDDIVDFSVEVTSHTVDAYSGGGTVLLGSVAGDPINAATPFQVENHGVEAGDLTFDAWIVWTFTIGANDEMRVPFDGGFDGESIQVNIFNHSQKCVDKMNNSARKVADRAQKSDVKCVKRSTGLATLCVDAPGEAKTLKKETQLIEQFALQCNPLPAWGVAGGSCCYGGTAEDGDACVDSTTCGGGICADGGCIAESAEAGANDLTHDLYGPAVTIATDALERKCQHRVTRAAGKLLTEQWRWFRTCKRDDFTTIANDADLASICLTPIPDPKGKVAKRVSQIDDAINVKCTGKEVTGLAALFPGECAAEPDGTIGACFATRAQCRFCQSINAADEIVPPVDCDLFDDNVANASCP